MRAAHSRVCNGACPASTSGRCCVLIATVANLRRRRSVVVATLTPDRRSEASGSSSNDVAVSGMSAHQLAALRNRLDAQLAKIQYPDPRPAYESTHGEDEPEPTHEWKVAPHHLNKEQLWAVIKHEAAQDAAEEPGIASLLHSTILNHNRLEDSMAFLLATKLTDPLGMLQPVQLLQLISKAYVQSPDLVDALVADVQAVRDRDPACTQYLQCIMWFKGFLAVQSHRLAHQLYINGRKSLAFAIQSRISEAFQIDIHPNARLGRGILIDHATGVVIGETAVVGDNVSMLHHVTLGGSGTGHGIIRHPTIGHGVLLGAGSTVLGPVTIGAGSKIGAGSVVVTSLPRHCVAIGVPARVVKHNIARTRLLPNGVEALRMDQCVDMLMDYEI